MTPEEREVALKKMQQASNEFYKAAVSIGNHPFIEFAGLMNEYINACRDAHNEGIDFSECNRHRGQVLPLHSVRSDYLNEKLECIFSGAKILDGTQCEPVGAALD